MSKECVICKADVKWYIHVQDFICDNGHINNQYKKTGKDVGVTG